MPRRPGTRLLALSAVLTLAVSLAACGGDDGGEKIPPDDAGAMLATAGEIDEATSSQDCEQAQASTTELRGQVEALPEETDPEIVDALDQMVSRLDEELDAECAETGTTDAEEETTEPETTVAPTTTETIPTETTTEPPPEEDDGEEGGGPPPQPPGQSGGGPPLKPEVPGQGGGPAPPTGGTEEDG